MIGTRNISQSTPHMGGQGKSTWMRIDVIALFPELVQAVCQCGITGRACDRGLLAVQTWNPREYTCDIHRTVDDRPYGGGPGMVMKPEPLAKAIDAVLADRNDQPAVIYLSPQGKPLRQEQVMEWSRGTGLVLLAGRYEGVDERLVQSRVDTEISIGDYVLSGGELPAMVVIDALARLLPGALGNAESADQDSYMHGLLDYPHYTRPEVFEDRQVPPVLLTGHHQQVAHWRTVLALGRTQERRQDLITARGLSDEEKMMLNEYLEEQMESMK